MNDDVQSLAVGAQPASGQPQKSPLDVLQEILEDAKNAQGAKDGQSPAATPATDTNEDKTDDEVGEEMKQKMAESQARDQELLEQQKAEFAGVFHSPQNQARLQQKQEEEDKRSSTQTSQDGFQIEQIKHTKI